MIKKIALLFFVGCIISCSNNNDTKTLITEISGEYTHPIPNCTNLINCTEFISFNNHTNVTFLINGGDIIFDTTYTIKNNIIIFSPTEGFNTPISFLINEDGTLTRIDNDDIWIKSE